MKTEIITFTRNEVDQIVIENAAASVVEEEILASLEETVMQAFQQIVYYLTKVHVRKTLSRLFIQLNQCLFDDNLNEYCKSTLKEYV